MNPLRTNGFARRCRVATRGFSLVEVLIAVLVLGVGLLGLASVFPVVISQQRDATDVIRGGVASNAIRDQIRSNPEIATELLSQDGLVDADEPDQDGDRNPNEPGNDNDAASFGQGEPVFGWHTQYRPTNTPIAAEVQFNPLTGYSYLWEADWNWSVEAVTTTLPQRRYRVVGANLLDDYVDDGGVRFRDPQERSITGVTASQPDLPMAARLYPRPYSSPGELRDGPLYVWDFVPRRTPAGSVQFAVFVRRIDTGIRLGNGVTLSETLADPGSFNTFAVGRDTATRLPTFDGTGEYSVPVSARAIPIPSEDYPFRPEFRVAPEIPFLLDGVRVLRTAGDTEIGTVQSAEEVATLAAVGQRFVDNLGIVRTVVEVLGEQPGQWVDLRVEPPLTRNAIEPPFDEVANSPESFSQIEGARVGKLRQIVFTPQQPVDVFVMEFNR